jgi:hypothetical protein
MISITETKKKQVSNRAFITLKINKYYIKILIGTL